MEQGKDDEDERRRLESRRKAVAYGLPAVERHFRQYLSSDVLQLSGICDLVLELDGAQRAAPVEFKSTDERLDVRHQVQLAGYGLLLEQKYQCQVNFGYLVTLPSGQATSVAITKELRALVLMARDEALAMLDEGIMPAPADRRAKCRDCEFKRFCNDIW